jgi:hypothetical protein
MASGTATFDTYSLRSPENANLRILRASAEQVAKVNV